jgi:hypothetical protein
MATPQRKPNPQMISPKGVFVYPALTKPDYGTKDFPKPNGEYKVTLRIATPAVEKFLEGAVLAAVIAQAQAEADEGFKALKVDVRKKLKAVTWNEVATVEYDKETEEPTGFMLLKFKMNASGKRVKDQSVWTAKPGIFDSKGVALPKPPEIWGGSEGLISFEASPYFIPGTGAAGVSFRLKAVQLIKVVSGGSRDAAGFGFAAQEDGFDASEYQAPAEEFGGAGQAGDPGASPDEF